MKNTLDKHVVAYQGDSPYDFDNKILLNWYPQRVLRHAEERGSILELGLGHGVTANIFSGYFERHVVLEGSAAVIRNFREKNPSSNAKIVETYFEEFVTDECFDVIIMGFILEHVDDPQQILRYYRQFLTPNGKMFLAVPNAEALNRRLGHLAGMLDDMTALSENDHLQGHKRFYTVKTFTNDIEEAGYRTVWMEGIYLKPLTTTQMISLKLGEKIIRSMCEIGVSYPELSLGILVEVSCC